MIKKLRKNKFLSISLAVIAVAVCTLLGVIGYTSAADATPTNIASSAVSIKADFSEELATQPDWWAKDAYGELSDLLDGDDSTGYRDPRYYAQTNVDEYIYMTFDKTYDVSSLDLVYSMGGGGTRVPVAYNLSVWVGNQWVEVGNQSNKTSGTVDRPKWTLSSTITCSAMRLNITEFNSAWPSTLLFDINVWGTASDDKVDFPPTNVAYGKTTYYADLLADRATYLTDGNHGTWASTSKGSSAEDSKVIYVDLGDTYTLNKINLAPRSGGTCFPVDYYICVWDGYEWREVARETGATASTKSYTFEEIDANAIRIVATKLSLEGANAYLQLGEIEAHGVTSTKSYIEKPDFRPEQELESVALDTTEAKNPVADGNSWTYTFDKAYEVNEIILTGGVPAQYQIELWDGTNWHTVDRRNSADFTNGRLYTAVDEFASRALRISSNREITGAPAFDANLIVHGEALATNIIKPSEVIVAANVAGTAEIQFDAASWATNNGADKLNDGTKLQNSNFATTNSFDPATTKEVYLTFDKAYQIDEILLYPAVQSGTYRGGFPVDFTISVWDGNEWREVANETNYSVGTVNSTAIAQLSGQKFEFAAIHAQAVRIIATKLGEIEGSLYALRFGEIEVMGIASDKTNIEKPSIVFEADNVAPASTAELSADKKSVTYTFDKTYTVNEIIFEDGITFPAQFTISAWDGANWQKVASRNSADFTTNRLYESIEAIDCRAICITSESDVSLLNKDSEIIIHGKDANINIKTPAEAGEVGENAALGAGIVDQDGKTTEDSRVEMNVPQEGYGLSFNVSKLTDGTTKGNNFATTLYTDKASADEEIIIRFENDKAYALNKIKLFPRVNGSGEYQGGFPESFKISVWDGIQWVEVSSMTGYKADEKVVAFAMDNVVANAVKIEVSKLGKADDGTQYVLQLAEVEAWGVEATESIDGPEDGVNAALSGTPVMNVPTATWAQDNYPATELVDDVLAENNNFATTAYAAVPETEESIEITFKDGKAYEVDKIKLFPRVDENGAYVGGFPEDFVVSVWDGEEWKQVAAKTGYESTGKVLVLELDEAVVCNALKVDVTKLGASEYKDTNPSQAYVLQIAEIQAWGVASDAELVTPDKAPEKGENAVLGAGVVDEEGLPVEDENRVFMNVPAEGYGLRYHVGQLTDGTKVGNNFATIKYVDVNLEENATEDIIITFADGAEYALHKIKLFPRVNGNGAYVGGFPQDFTLSVWNGTEWKEVAKETGYTAKADAYVLEEALKGNAIKISVSKLGASENFGQYVLQLAEVEAWGEKTGKTLALPVTEEPEDPNGGSGEGSEEQAGTNAALNGTVEMNVPKEGFGLSFPATKLTDGGTKGNSFATTAYVADNAQTEIITVVFKDGAAYTVDNIKIYPRVDANGTYMGGFPEDFKVSVWDGTKWVEVAAKTGYKGNADVLSLDITPTLCNAVKVEVSKFGASENAGQYVLQLAEIEAYGESSNAKLQTPPVEGEQEEEKETGTNAALNGTVQFTVPTWGKNFPATMVVDGITAKNNNFTTSEYVTDAKDAETIMVAFKDGAYEINKIKLFPRANGTAYQGGFPEDFKVSVWNGTKWVEVASKTGYKSGASALSISIDKIVCNAIKIEATKLGESENAGQYTLQFAEIEAWGEKSSQKLAAAPVSADGASASASTDGVTIDNEKNLALNRPVYASSDLAQYNAPISKVNDGNLSSYWASNDREFVKGEPQWAMVNLLNNFSIHTVVLGARQQALGFPIDFKVEVFYDGEWQEVVSEVGFAANEKAGYTAYEFKFPAVIGNKVRVSSDNFRKVGTSNSMVLTEIAVYGDSVTGDYVLPNENMLTPGALITATTSMEDYDYYIKHLIDGNFLTGWSSVPSTDPNSVQSVEIDMQGEVQISEIQLKPSWGGNGFPIDFTISVYENGEWVEVYEAVDYEKPEDEAIQRFQFETRKATKFKITVTKMAEEAGLYVWKMNEILAYPSHTGDEFDPDRVAEVNSSLQFASAEVVPSEEGFFESVQLWKIIAGGILAIIAIGGCIAIIVSGKKKKTKEE